MERGPHAGVLDVFAPLCQQDCAEGVEASVVGAIDGEGVATRLNFRERGATASSDLSSQNAMTSARA